MPPAFEARRCAAAVMKYSALPSTTTVPASFSIRVPAASTPPAPAIPGQLGRQRGYHKARGAAAGEDRRGLPNTKAGIWSARAG